MSHCVNERLGWWSAEPNRHGYRYPVFDPESGDQNRCALFSCGKCVGCRQDRSVELCKRAIDEASLHERCCFGTFTYEAEPASLEAVRRDVDLMFKRLRKAERDFRYLRVCERGGKYGRPHAHVVFYGEDFLDGAIDMSNGLLDRERYYWNPELTSMWGHGVVVLAPANRDSIVYVASDAVKNFGSESYVSWSRKPMLGYGWLKNFHSDLSRNNFATVDGKKFPAPRAYLRRPEFKDQFASLKAKRLEHCESVTLEDIERRLRTAEAREINLFAALGLRLGKL